MNYYLIDNSFYLVDVPGYGFANRSKDMKDSFGDYDSNVTGHSFHIAANNKTKIINMSAVVPYDIEVDSKKLIGGK